MGKRGMPYGKGTQRQFSFRIISAPAAFLSNTHLSFLPKLYWFGIDSANTSDLDAKYAESLRGLVGARVELLLRDRAMKETG